MTSNLPASCPPDGQSCNPSKAQQWFEVVVNSVQLVVILVVYTFWSVLQSDWTDLLGVRRRWPMTKVLPLTLLLISGARGIHKVYDLFFDCETRCSSIVKV